MGTRAAVDTARRRARGQGGFTLVEGLVVIAILAILGGTAVFAVTGLTNEADVNACSAERRTIMVAMGAATGTSRTDDSYGDYLSGAPKYFENSGSPSVPVWGPSGEHPGAGCPSTIPNP